MKYTIERFNGQTARQATSLRDALRIAREWLGETRVYRGSQYVTDSDTDRNGERKIVAALDVCRTRKAAIAQQSVTAPIVISWPEQEGD